MPHRSDSLSILIKRDIMNSSLDPCWVFFVKNFNKKLRQIQREMILKRAFLLLFWLASSHDMVSRYYFIDNDAVY